MEELVFITFVGVPAALFALTVYLRWRERMQLLDVVRITAEQGKPLSAEILDSLRRRPLLQQPDRDHRRGVFLVAFAVAVVLVALCAFVLAHNLGAHEALAISMAIAGFGALPGCIGVALIVLSRKGQTPRVD